MANELMLLGCGPAGASAAEFSPADVTGLVLWLDASEGTYQSTGGSAALADGDPVGEWQDQSGNGNHVTQATGTAKPTLKTGANGLNGLPVLRFDGTDDWLLSATAAYAVKHWFVVAKHAGATFSGYEGLLTGPTGASESDIVLTGNYGDTKWYTATGPFSTATYRKDGVTLATGSRAAPMDAFAVMSVQDSTGWNVVYQIGKERSTNYVSDRFWTGDVVAVLGYSDVLADADREAVEAYLMDRYGL